MHGMSVDVVLAIAIQLPVSITIHQSCLLSFFATHDLQLDPLSIQLNGPNLKVDTNRRNERRRPSIVTESQQETRLSYSRVSNKEELKQQIIMWIWHRRLGISLG